MHGNNTNIIKIFVISAILLSSLAIQACTPVGIMTGAGAAVGVSAAREGGISGTLTDLRIEADISDKWFKYDLDTFSKLNITVLGGRVMLTGIVQEQNHRVEAVRLAWQAEGVKEVINEININEAGTAGNYLNDKWIATRLRTALTLDGDVQSINYAIEVVRGVVYVLGTAYTQNELNQVIATARTIPNVRQVVSYIKLADGNVQQKTSDGTGVEPAPKINEDY